MHHTTVIELFLFLWSQIFIAMGTLIIIIAAYTGEAIPLVLFTASAKWSGIIALILCLFMTFA